MTGRLFPAGADGPATRLDDHYQLHGPLPHPRGGQALMDAVAGSGLQGRGGAGFPTARKLAAVAGRRGPAIVLANGAEGEPASHKDKLLLRRAPHLVLDGAVAAAGAVGAAEAIIAIAVTARRELGAVTAAIAERRAAGIDGSVRLRTIAVPDRFVTGEESALVQFCDGGPAKPVRVPPRPFERGIRGRPTLVQNVETLAHLALIARFGAAWFRAVGTVAEPGSALVTVSGAVRRPGVYEVPLGEPFRAVVERAGGETAPLRAFLVGGYFGGWVDADQVAELTLSDADLRPAGAGLGARAIVALPQTECGVVASARVARYLARQSAGQCGPCVHGLAAIAGALERLASGELETDERPRLRRWLGQVTGRGACRHPDGAARFVGSALRVFADEIELHLGAGTCSASASLAATR